MMRSLLLRFFLRDDEDDNRRVAFWRGVRRSVDPLYGHGVFASHAHANLRTSRGSAMSDMGLDWQRVGDDLEAAITQHVPREK